MQEPFQKEGKDKIHLSKALAWILISTLLISGSSTLLWLYFEHIKALKSQDSKYTIKAIVQTGPEKEALKTKYFAELLNLSIDQPINLYSFNLKEAKHRLLSSPVIEKAEIKKISPCTIYIDYTARQPIAILYDFENAVIDDNKVIFPLKPFFTPKKLPEIRLGMTNILNSVNDETISWGNKLESKRLDLAFILLDFLSREEFKTLFSIKRIDVSYSDAESYGKRQIVLILEDRFEINKNGKFIFCLSPKIIRLNVKNWKSDFANYLVLRDHLINQERLSVKEEAKSLINFAPLVIDMRVSDIALLKRFD